MDLIPDTSHHFPIMIIASVFVFYSIIWFCIGKRDFNRKLRQISILSFFVVVIGMMFGKYGANWGLPWWIYYPFPMIMTVFLPPIILKMNQRKTLLYLVLSFLSAPFIHVIFSFFLGWNEYMPFWKVPAIYSLF